MLKSDWTLCVYKSDGRTKSGYRLVSTSVWRDRDEAAIKREKAELGRLYPVGQGFVIEQSLNKSESRGLL